MTTKANPVKPNTSSILNNAHQGICQESDIASSICTRDRTSDLNLTERPESWRFKKSVCPIINMKNEKNGKVVITNKTNKFTLVTRPEIAPKGTQQGVITEVVNVTGTEDGEEFNRRDNVVELESKNSKGEAFSLTKSYNLAESGRGLALFLRDYNSLKSANLSKTDLYDFDPQTLQGERVKVEVDYSETGKDVASVIKNFLPPEETLQPAPALAAA